MSAIVQGSSVHSEPVVGVVMGSASDLPVMKAAADALTQFSVPHEVRILSAHRTPGRMSAYARAASSRGLKVIIAGAGGSAHLPGMSASETRLPVLGVAIESQPDPLNAAIGSMLRMPKGAPLGTMGKNEAAAWNAGLMAVRILAVADEALGDRYDRFIAELADQVARDDDALVEMGAAGFLEAMEKAARERASGGS